MTRHYGIQALLKTGKLQLAAQVKCHIDIKMNQIWLELMHKPNAVLIGGQWQRLLAADTREWQGL
ncbi:hypothetical protein Pcaca04_00350 [Pectobacterium carotovorum subsp. carotovorum]|nr:hypothetical protein Pcaca04_00350 [Pectobacterium carotovorum subsp. carotovorum]